MSRLIGVLVAMLLAVAVAPFSAFANDRNSCSRPDPGTLIQAPPDLFSLDGALNASFEYYTTVDSAGRTLFCFVTPDGLQSPTLHLHPGDRLNLSVTNRNPPPPPGSPTRGRGQSFGQLRRHDNDDHIAQRAFSRDEHFTEMRQ
jgi:hypothetical protein